MTALKLTRRQLIAGGVIAAGSAGYAAPQVLTLIKPAAEASGLTSCGRMTGGGRINPDTTNARYGYELHCVPTANPNNLEVTFPAVCGKGKNKTTSTLTFKLDSIVTVKCTSNGNPTPPKANFNTLTLTGTGHTEPGKAAATISLVLVDNGEPGTKDQTMFDIHYTCDGNAGEYSSAADTVRGNNQAHGDPKHC